MSDLEHRVQTISSLLEALLKEGTDPLKSIKIISEKVVFNNDEILEALAVIVSNKMLETSKLQSSLKEANETHLAEQRFMQAECMRQSAAFQSQLPVIATANEKIAQLRFRLNTEMDKSIDATTELKIVKEENATLEEVRKNLKTDNDNLRTHIKNLDAEMKTKDATLQDLNTRLHDANIKLAENKDRTETKPESNACGRVVFERKK